ncbi:hypothetical protein [Reticulibacter mediterranei]|uniref:hypothetical protein n=1 Tax=Reticulibacter mediterranei TaxID=2778369 RepID=UPI001C69347E|nr:hypothetical protein [Reticulibacter mediterranei]
MSAYICKRGHMYADRTLFTTRIGKPGSRATTSLHDPHNGSGNAPHRHTAGFMEQYAILRLLARPGPHTPQECGVLQATQSSVEVMEASCEGQVQQLRLW